MPKTDKHRDTERLREWCYEAQAKRGKKRQAVCVETCFAPLRAWVLSGWTGTQLALALDATTWGNRFGVLAISVLYPTPESAPPPRGTGPGCRYRDWWDRHSGRPACGPNGEGGGYRSRRRHAGVCPAEADRAGLTHVEFREGDAEHLDFPDQCFDVVLCVASLFFVPDMLAALREWWRVLVPGGYVGFCGFGPTFLQPLRDLWTARLQQYGVTPAAFPWQRLADLATCQHLLHEAGFDQIEVQQEQLGYYLQTVEEWWEESWASPGRLAVLQLTPVQPAQFKAEHLAEVAALATAQARRAASVKHGLP